MLKDLFQKEWFRLVGVLLIGITIGVIFYPTKRIEERMTQKHMTELAAVKEQHLKEVQEVTDRYTASVEENKQLRKEAEVKIAKLTQEVKTLQSKQKTAYYKIVRPDGTIEEKQFTSSEVNESSQVITKIQVEFKEKIDQIETKWETIHQERISLLKRDFSSRESNYKKTIDELQRSRVEVVNEKRFGLEAGILNNKNYYGHATMDVWGPTFLGVHGEVGPNRDASAVGVGIGLRF